MDPGKLVETLVQKYFPKFGSLRKKCTYQETGSAVENLDTGIVSPSIISTHPDLYVIFDGPTTSLLRVQLLDNMSIKTIDRVAIFPALDLPIVPKTNDRIIDHLSNEWQVLAVFQDPQPGHYELLIRPV